MKSGEGGNTVLAQKVPLAQCPQAQSRKAVFLDRDGVISRKAPEGDYIKSAPEFEFLPLAGEALALLTAHGYLVIVVTNQRGIARGLMTETDLKAIHDRMTAELAAMGARLDAIYHCPHERGTCNCRKPLTGMFEQARADFPGLEFPSAFVIGDTLVDMEAGSRLGCTNILIGAPSDRDVLVAQATRAGIEVQFVAGSLYEAVTGFVLAGPEREVGD